MSFSIDIKGLDKTLEKLSKLDDEIKKEVDSVMYVDTFNIAGQIVAKAPIGRSGFLHNHIRQRKIAPLNYVIESDMKYSAYLNWGTVTRVSVSSFWKEYAMTFKGKGIRKSGGIFPTFFFTGPVDRGIPKMIQKIKEIINK
jgi:hypothetical protein